jgi:signal transduction histidine kinase
MPTEPVIQGLAHGTPVSANQLQRENERLRQRNALLEEQVRSLVRLQATANAPGVEDSPRPLLRRIAAAALRLTVSQASALSLLDEAHTALVAQSVENEQSAADSGSFAVVEEPAAEEAEAAAPKRIEMGSGLAGWVAQSGELALIEDVQTDSRFSAETYAVDGQMLGIAPAALLAVPLLWAGDVIGVLEVAHSAGTPGFDATSLDMLQTLAAQAAAVVANAERYAHLHSERDRILTAQEEVSRRLAHELHVGPSQQLAQIVMTLDYAEQLGKHDLKQVLGEVRRARELAQTTTRDLRRMLFDLRSLALETEDGGLVAALQHYLDRVQQAPEPKMHLHADYPEPLSERVEASVFAVVQEAVSNVLKHASASNCWIDLRETPEKLVVTVRDDGAGFDVKQVQAEYETRGSWGLLSMLERANLVDGKLAVASQPGRGTATSLEVPR